MPTYVLPQFNIHCNIWFPGSDPDVDPPDGDSICQLRGGPASRVSGWVVPLPDDETAARPPLWQLLLPPLTDIRWQRQFEPQGHAEVPAFSGRIYVVAYVDDVAKGFPNEYRLALVTLRPPVTFPMP